MEGSRVERVDSKEKAFASARCAAELKAGDVVILDVSRLASFADYFVICGGRSNRQVQGIAERIEAELKDLGVKPIGVEGTREGHWILMDYGDVIVHVFYEATRLFYDLESLWAEAPAVRFDQSASVSDAALRSETK